MAITLKNTDKVKYGLAEIKTTAWRVSGKTGTIGQSSATGTYYITEELSKTFPGPVEEVTSASNVHSYSIKGKIVTCYLKGNQPNTTVSAVLSVKYSTSQDVFVINKKDGTTAWRKCKPVTLIFDTTKIKHIGIVGDGTDYEVSTSGTTQYLPCKDSYSLFASPKTGYMVTTEEKTVNLLNISSLILSDFDPITYTFEAATATYSVVVQPPTLHITSASLVYTQNGIQKTIAVPSVNPQTIQVDAGTSVHYTSIVPNTGYTACYTSNDKFTPTGNNYLVPVLKVLPKKPTITATIWVDSDRGAPYYKYYVTVTNPNPYKLYCRVIASNNPLSNNAVLNADYQEIAANSTLIYPNNTGFGLTSSSGSFTIYAKACLDIYDDSGNTVTVEAVRNWATGSSGITTTDTQYGSTST